MSLVNRLFLGFTLLSVAACDREGQSLTAPILPAVVGSQESRRLRTLDDEFESMAESAPGFGGLYFDASGTLQVFVKGDNNVRLTPIVERFLLAAMSSANASTALNSMQVRRADYDFRELRGWYKTARDVYAHPAVTYTDIDEGLNRIVIGVMPGTNFEVIRDLITMTGVPTGAIVVQEAAPTNITATLQQNVRPVVGGLRINAGGGQCTLTTSGHRLLGDWINGFTVDTSERYFLTNSHCTDAFGSVTGVTAGQPTASDPIGTEVADPSLFTSAQNSACPVGRYCRYADAALFEYDDGITMSWGGIAHVAINNLNITGTDSVVNLGVPTALIEGWTNLDMVGATSGRTRGTTVSTCADVRQYQNSIDTGRTMLCQARVGYAFQGGDSGAPVISSNDDAGKTMYGIHWGSSWLEPGPGPIISTFSAIGLALDEIRTASGIGVALCASCYF